jgi:hypothetical protein
MEIIYIVFLSIVVRLIVSAIRDREAVTSTLGVRPSLCRDCAYAHIARGFRDRDELIACTYAGVMRPIKFAVSDCSMFCSRNANSAIVRIAGFADVQGRRFVSNSTAGGEGQSSFDPDRGSFVLSGEYSGC